MVPLEDNAYDQAQDSTGKFLFKKQREKRISKESKAKRPGN